jgi:ABC-type nickel/cobalt efflux system permease component RcnA/ABC-type uncharacterized transport system substrate-binding protein
MHRIPLLCLLAVLAALLSGPLARPCLAHPHVFVDASLAFVVDGHGLASVREDWLFDEIFTQAILGEVGLTPASLDTPEGQAAIKQGAFDYLANFGYFTFIENRGVRLPVTEVRDFRASLRQGRLDYAFTVDLNLGFGDMKDFRVAVYDKEYYTDILLLKDKISFTVDGPARVSHAVRSAKDLTYWQFIVPEAVHLAVSDPSGQGETVPSVAAVAGDEEDLGLLVGIMNKVRAAQKWLTLKLNGFGLDIRANPFGPALWLFLGFAFVYGVVHAVGPGHGKAVVCSYFLSRPGSFLSGAIMGNAITFVHMGSAGVAVAVAYLVFSAGMGGVAEASLALQPASYGLLVLMGAFLLVKALRDLARGGLIAEPSCPAPGNGPAQPENLRELLLVAFVTGLVPCPGAAVILAFAVGQDIFWAGLAAIVVMAAGMGVTTTLFAWGAVAARSATLKLSARNRHLFNWVYAGLSIGGAAVIGLFGAVLLMSSSVWH